MTLDSYADEKGLNIAHYRSYRRGMIPAKHRIVVEPDGARWHVVDEGPDEGALRERVLGVVKRKLENKNKGDSDAS